MFEFIVLFERLSTLNINMYDQNEIIDTDFFLLYKNHVFLN